MHFKTLHLLAALTATVNAHGYVESLTAGGVTYSGMLPYNDPYVNPRPDRVVRDIPSNGPVQDMSLIDIQCNGYSAGGMVGSKPAKLHMGPVAAGSSVTLKWTIWPNSHKGPLITYMAKCPSNNCANYVPGTAAVWFKIQEAGRVGTSTVWASDPLENDATRTYTYKIPACLSAGAYIVRHEVFGLHSAGSLYGAQVYPSCHQIKITGSGTSSGPTNKVSFPGAYKNTDPGILYDMYKAQTYPIPGPAVWKC